MIILTIILQMNIQYKKVEYICCSVNTECSLVNQTLEISKNGSIIARKKLESTSNGSSGIINILVKLEKGDIIFPQITQESGSIYLLLGNDMTYFNMVLNQRIPQK